MDHILKVRTLGTLYILDDEYPALEMPIMMDHGYDPARIRCCLYECCEPLSHKLGAKICLACIRQNMAVVTNIAEIELSILRSATRSRIANKKILTSEVATGRQDRNNFNVQIILGEFEPDKTSIK